MWASASSEKPSGAPSAPSEPGLASACFKWPRILQEVSHIHTYIRQPRGREQNGIQLESWRSIIATREAVFDEETI